MRVSYRGIVRAAEAGMKTQSRRMPNLETAVDTLQRTNGTRSARFGGLLHTWKYRGVGDKPVQI
jgi:hypothetical protein